VVWTAILNWNFPAIFPRMGDREFSQKAKFIVAKIAFVMGQVEEGTFVSGDIFAKNKKIMRRSGTMFG
jgi:hypothetical protein